MVVKHVLQQRKRGAAGKRPQHKERHKLRRKPKPGEERLYPGDEHGKRAGGTEQVHRDEHGRHKGQHLHEQRQCLHRAAGERIVNIHAPEQRIPKQQEDQRGHHIAHARCPAFLRARRPVRACRPGGRRRQKSLHSTTADANAKSEAMNVGSTTQ